MNPTSWPCLTLTHTRGWEARDRSDDRLTDYSAVVAWAEEQGVVAASGVPALLAEASARPDRAQAVLTEIVAVRGLLYRIFSRVAVGEAPSEEDVAELGNRVGAQAVHRRLIPETALWRWQWDDDPRALERVVWPVVQSAVNLLTSELLIRVRLCEGDGCGWLFVDASRNRSRRWCDMSDCGNLAKVRRYRRRRSEDAV